MILVCYLIAAGEVYAERARVFEESYKGHTAGALHRMMLVLKEGAELPESAAWRNWSDGDYHSCDYVVHSNEGLDIGSLQQVMRHAADCEFVMWLGTHVRILADDWLAKFEAAMRLPDVGAAAATGSYEQGVSSRFPNPHLRPSALMVRPEVFDSLELPRVDSRLGTYEFEHGDGSFYVSLVRAGLQGVVVGRNGVYHEHEWAESHTFRNGEQEELLIADNHTDMYAAGSPEVRRALTRMTGWEP